MATRRALGGRAAGGAAGRAGIAGDGGASGRRSNWSTTGFDFGGGAGVPRPINVKPNPAWTTMATPAVTRSTLRDKTALGAGLRVERELRHAQLADDVDEVHDVAVGDPLVRGDDRLKLGI